MARKGRLFSINELENMKRIALTLAALALFLVPVRADEGMWLLPLLEKMNSDVISSLGCRLSVDEIYSINHSSIKDAVVQFGGGCTGEIISDRGLLVTNHHCGYGSIQSLSTPEHNYLENGYWAMNYAEEIPVPGLTVRFLQSMTDVTDEIEKLEKKGPEALEAGREALIKKYEAANPYCKVQLTSFYNSNVWYIIVSKIYRDVRFVGAPPASQGKFGGETDNWMWPRHTCDFSMFRVYAGKDNQPADYSPSNVPMAPRQSLKVSLRGVHEGDFAMIMGYPGSTQRFMTADELQAMIDRNDVRIAARTVRQEVLWAEMRADEKVSLQYASKYASSSNGWKKWQGEKQSFGKLGIIAREKQKESDFTAWVNAKASRVKKYSGAIEKIDAYTAEALPAQLAGYLLTETLGNIELLGLVDRMSDRLYKDYDVEVDRKVAFALLDHYLANVKPEDKVDITPEELENAFENSVYTTLERRDAAIALGADLSADPAAVLLRKIVEKYREINSRIPDRTEADAARKAFTAGLLEWKKDEPSYPDANMTCRLTYGNVLSYSPKDGVIYNYYTTLKGVMEKEEPGNYEFRVPERLKEIYTSKDFGQYANEKGEMPACFLTNLDITGGNSGSPVLDADGALIGLAFDGNWEAMSSDVMFEPELQRCICVDIRYVLMMMDKFGGAGYLLDEMHLVK